MLASQLAEEWQWPLASVGYTFLSKWVHEVTGLVMLLNFQSS